MSARPARVKVSAIKEGDYLRVEVRRAPELIYLSATNYRDSEVVIVKAVDRWEPKTRPPGYPWRLVVQRGDGRLILNWWNGFTTMMVGHPRLVIDEDCPNCNYPERWLDPVAKRFGCSHCDYTSRERAT